MKEYKLKELLEIKNGKDHSSVGVGNIPIFGSGGIMRYGDEFLYNDESILLPRKGSLSNIQYVNQPFWTVDTIYYSIINKEKAVPYYLYNYLRLLDLSKLNSGTGVPSMTYDSYYNIKVNLPEPKIQKQVANILSALDDKIELNNRINEVLEAKAKLLYDYWFVQFEFPTPAGSSSGIEGKPYKSSGGKMVYNKKLKREIPEGWEVKRLEELGDFKNGVNYDPSKPGPIACPIINVRNISASTYFIKNDDLDVIYLKQSEADKYMVNDNSIIIARSGIPGATRLINEHLDNTLYCGFAIHFDLKDVKQKNILFFFLKSIEMMIQSGAGGTIMKNVNQQTLKKLLVSMPKENEIIKEFNKQLEPIFNRIKNIQKQNQHLASLRDWLLPMLMNGQVGVERAYEIVDGELGMVAEPGERYGESLI